ncbi:MAG: DDE-type integrase/transposase/recombinase [Thermoleophilia bacterium]|nr:DDE-type integrase/transposase/recombinase [Thermoleophilia bacterium]
MTDNARCYTHSRAFAALLTRHGIRHLTTERYRPRTNGK